MDDDKKTGPLAQLAEHQISKNMKNWEKKEVVQNLRHQGLSYKEIRQRIPFAISKSIISDWCKDIELTELQKDRLQKLFKEGSYRGRLLGSKVTQTRRANEVREIKEKAGLEISSLSKNEFKLAGLMLYWAEGNKSQSAGISNSDPELIRFMMRWFRDICGVPDNKFKIYLNIHSGQDDNHIKKFWSGIINLPVSQFGKSYIKKEGTGHRKNILYNGTIKIQICDKNLLYRILGWIKGIIKKGGPLAQLVEHQILNLGVEGSIPSRLISYEKLRTYRTHGRYRC